ncbi:hypothetical protein EV132_10316 [Rhizobium sullae]|uniref:Uncharacterized protein n=1 Tax=Rhizobium sullae TaxID=50338 RepID=A0A4R3Q910_RHISU|nr:hypothetical protein EV132_10316 [Rhizobium sullae]
MHWSDDVFNFRDFTLKKILFTWIEGGVECQLKLFQLKPRSCQHRAVYLSASFKVWGCISELLFVKYGLESRQFIKSRLLGRTSMCHETIPFQLWGDAPTPSAQNKNTKSTCRGQENRHGGSHTRSFPPSQSFPQKQGWIGPSRSLSSNYGFRHSYQFHCGFVGSGPVPKCQSRSARAVRKDTKPG